MSEFLLIKNLFIYHWSCLFIRFLFSWEKRLLKSLEGHSYTSLVDSQISIIFFESFLSSLAHLVVINVSFHPVISPTELLESLLQCLTRIVIDKILNIVCVDIGLVLADASPSALPMQSTPVSWKLESVENVLTSLMFNQIKIKTSIVSPDLVFSCCQTWQSNNFQRKGDIVKTTASWNSSSLQLEGMVPMLSIQEAKSGFHTSVIIFKWIHTKSQIYTSKFFQQTFLDESLFLVTPTSWSFSANCRTHQTFPNTTFDNGITFQIFNAFVCSAKISTVKQPSTFTTCPFTWFEDSCAILWLMIFVMEGRFDQKQLSNQKSARSWIFV